MKYEIDFIGVKGEGGDAAAIAMRYWPDETKDEFKTLVFDGGSKEYGKALCDILEQYYFNNRRDKTINYLFCSHAHQDHCAGILELMEKFDIGLLVINDPKDFSEEILNKIDDQRRTEDSIKKGLEKKEKIYHEVMETANNKRIRIARGMQGNYIKATDKLFFTVLSPTAELFAKKSAEHLLDMGANKAPSNGKQILDPKTEDVIKDSDSTSPINETSIVLHCNMGDETILLTGDAGEEGLGTAIRYAKKKDIDLTAVNVYQAPHHGSRHNVPSKILEQLVGPIVDETAWPKIKKTVFVCAGGNDDKHPHPMTVNAFKKRGCRVYVAKNFTIRHHYGNVPAREGWGPSKQEQYSDFVEGY